MVQIDREEKMNTFDRTLVFFVVFPHAPRWYL